MPDSRPSRPNALPMSDDTDDRPREFDHPLATGSPYPYPSRFARLNRALRSTANLLADLEDRNASASASSVDSAPSSVNRRRRFSLIDSEDLPPHLQYASEFPLSSLRDTTQIRRELGRDQGSSTLSVGSRQSDQRPAKRRRYESSNPVSMPRPLISYGHYGQVEPGCLEMEIVSCDGGEMVDHRSPQVYLGQQNVLKADKSVYCSSQRHVSMILQHADATTFCIDKLHIVGPEHGFDSPVTNGVILIAMDLEYLKNYQDRSSRPQNTDKNVLNDESRQRIQRLRRQCARGGLSLAEALRDPDIAAYYHDRITRNNTDTQLDSSSEADGTLDAFIEPQLTHRSLEEVHGTPLLEHNAATSHVFDSDLAQDDTSTQETIDYRNHRQHTRSRQRSGLFNGAQYQPMMLPSSLAMSNRDNSSSSVHVDQSSQTESKEQSREAYSVIASICAAAPDQVPPWKDPQIHFVPFMLHPGKSRIAIKFDPQVNGRYMLLKLAGDKHNVDIQSIVVSGFAGQRFFPAKQAR